MGYKVECRLPPLNSLALDFALPQQTPQDYAFHFDPARSLESTRTLPNVLHSNAAQLKPDVFTAAKFNGYHNDPFANPNPARMGTPVIPPASYVAIPYTACSSKSSSLSDASNEPHPTFLPVPCHIPAVNEKSDSRPLSEEPHSDPESASPDASENADSESPEPLKKRKKRQCPQCLHYYSNLATHRSTHLNPTARPHVCKVCQRGFARPNDLFRHFKCHWKEMGADQGQFKCPFKTGKSGDKCSHTLGIFSRCDTYKNHLKAIHFQYPEGTKKSNRNKIPGTCKVCQKEFKSVDDWISLHIESHECEAIE